MPSFEQSELKKKETLTVKNSNTGDVLKVIFPNGIQIGIPNANQFNKGIILPSFSSAPVDVTNVLYVLNDTVYYNGSVVGIPADDENTILASQVFG